MTLPGSQTLISNSNKDQMDKTVGFDDYGNEARQKNWPTAKEFMKEQQQMAKETKKQSRFL